MTTIRVKPSRTRKPTAARTCCETHADRCKFGHSHIWFLGIYDETGTFHPDRAQCGRCQDICTGEESA